MSAYITVMVDDIHDLNMYRRYGEAWNFESFSGSYGGEILMISDEEPDDLEGSWSGRLVVMRFPDSDKARAWYESTEYHDVRELRWASSESRLALHRGSNMPGTAASTVDGA